jgi:plastocyanin
VSCYEYSVMAATRHHRAAAALAAVIAAVLLVLCTGNSGTKTAPFTPTAMVQPTSTITVTIKNFAYMPAHFTVAPGATVTVRNEDNVIHTLAANNLAFNTGNVTRGQPVTFTAPTKPGTYPFHDLRYPYVTGVLTVA